MITKPDLAQLSRPYRDHPTAREVYYRPIDEIEAFLASRPPREGWDQRLIQHCNCCGERGTMQARSIVRCEKHIGRNPCAIEGCTRTLKAQGDGRGFWYSNDLDICGRHWRELIPPGSPERRVYLRLWRLRKKLGDWTPELDARYWRVWPRLISIARARAAGDIDEAEIKRLFGWD